MAMLTNLAEICRAAGLDVTEVDGWKTRGRPGGMSDIRTITCHHTANGGAPGDAPSLAVVRNGRPGLPGPLAQLVLGRSGRVYVVAAGKCNHAGVSKSSDYENSHAIGIEAEAKGTPRASGDWPPEQMAAYATLCRALVRAFGVTTADVRGHKETCSPPGRKTDPSFPMATFRLKVASAPIPLHPKEEDVALTDADIKKIAAATADAVRTEAIANKNPEGPDGVSSMGGSIVDLERTQDRHTDELRDIKAQVQSNGGQLSNLDKRLTTFDGVLAEILKRLPAAE